MRDDERDPVGVDDEADLAVDVALDALDLEDLARLVRRLDEAGPSARDRFEAEVAGHRRTLAEVTADVAAEPPPALRERVLAAAGPGAPDARVAEPGTPAPTPFSSTSPPTSPGPGPRRSTGRRALAAAAAVAVLFGSGLAVGRLTAPDPGPAVAEREAGDRIRALLAAKDLRMQQEVLAGCGEAAVMYAPSTRTGALVVAGLAEPPAGHRVAVWHADPDSPPRAAATMGGAPGGAAGSAMLADLDPGDVLMLSVEPAGAPDDAGPTGPVLAEIDLR